MPSPLRDLARSKGLTLGQVGVRSAYVIACGRRRAGPGAIQRMADALGVSTETVAAACDAAWNSKQGLPASNPAPIDPGASSEVHAANPSAAVPA